MTTTESTQKSQVKLRRHSDSSVTTALSLEFRAQLAADPRLGAGNVFAMAAAINPARDEKILWLQKPLISFLGKRYESLSLTELMSLSREYAAAYVALGVVNKDPVAVYLDDGVEYLIHYIALTSLGAIPALVNGAMPGDVAARHCQRIGATLIVTDVGRRSQLKPEQQDKALTAADFSARFSQPGTLPALPLNYPYVHHDDDPIMIAHSSGTTGDPKPVLLQHKRFIYGVRYRLSHPPIPGERILSSLPHSHNCAIAYIMLAMLNGSPVMIASDHSGKAVLEAIQSFRPSMVVSFPQTFVEVTENEPETYDLSSVQMWMNGGDAAHEAHIRQLVMFGHHYVGSDRRSGSRFIDGMGSSEMGFSLFRHLHTPDTDVYDRCVGRPHDWVQAVVLADDGSELPAGKVGRLAVKAPSVTTGYWNDSLMTHKAQIRGFWLTGDLVYRDDEGRYFHVDRTPDLIRTSSGPFYSLQTEELLLKLNADISDLSIVAARGGSDEKPVALVRLKASATGRSAEALLVGFNRALAERQRPLISKVHLAANSDVPLGATGKVLKRHLREKYMEVSHA